MIFIINYSYRAKITLLYNCFNMQRNQENQERSQITSNSTNSRLQNTECPICFENYTPQNRRYKVCEGKHYVCMNCILQLHTKQCPLCKRWFKIQKRANNKLKILKGEREEIPETTAFNIGSIRALLLLIYARQNGELPESLLQVLLMNNQSEQEPSEIVQVNEPIREVQSAQQNQQASGSQIDVSEDSSFSIISQNHHQHIIRQQFQEHFRSQVQENQISLYSSSQQLDQNQVVLNVPARRRQIPIQLQNIVEQKSCDCSLFSSIQEGFNRMVQYLGLKRRQNPQNQYFQT